MACRKKTARTEMPKQKKLPGSKCVHRLRNVLGISCDALSDQMDELIDEIESTPRTTKPKKPSPAPALSDGEDPSPERERKGYRTRVLPGHNPPPSLPLTPNAAKNRKKAGDEGGVPFTPREKCDIRERLRKEDQELAVRKTATTDGSGRPRSVPETPRTAATRPPAAQRVSLAELQIGSLYHLRDRNYVDGVHRFEQIIRSRTTVQFLFRHVVSGAATTYTMHSIREVDFSLPPKSERD